MRAFKTRTFSKWQKKENITDKCLYSAIEEMHKGLIDADLGGGLVKKRVRKSGSGKSSGYRTLLATNRNDKWFFIYGFAKNDRDNINDQEEQALKKITKDLLNLSKTQIYDAIVNNELMEIYHE